MHSTKKSVNWNNFSVGYKFRSNTKMSVLFSHYPRKLQKMPQSNVQITWNPPVGSCIFDKSQGCSGNCLILSHSRNGIFMYVLVSKKNNLSKFQIPLNSPVKRKIVFKLQKKISSNNRGVPVTFCTYFLRFFDEILINSVYSHLFYKSVKK